MNEDQGPFPQGDYDRLELDRDRIKQALQKVYDTATRGLSEPLSDSTACLVDICTIIEELQL